MCLEPIFSFLAHTDKMTFLLFVMLQVKRLPPGLTGEPERCITQSIPPPNPYVMQQSEVHHEQPQGQLPIQARPPTQVQLRPQLSQPQSQSYPQHQLHAGPSSRAAEPAVVHSHRGSPLHLSADSACSSSSLPGRGSMLKPPTMPQWGENVTLMSQALG